MPLYQARIVPCTEPAERRALSGSGWTAVGQLTEAFKQLERNCVVRMPGSWGCQIGREREGGLTMESGFGRGRAGGLEPTDPPREGEEHRAEAEDPVGPGTPKLK